MTGTATSRHRSSRPVRSHWFTRDRVRCSSPEHQQLKARTGHSRDVGVSDDVIRPRLVCWLVVDLSHPLVHGGSVVTNTQILINQRCISNRYIFRRNRGANVVTLAGQCRRHGPRTVPGRLRPPRDHGGTRFGVRSSRTTLRRTIECPTFHVLPTVEAVGQLGVLESGSVPDARGGCNRLYTCTTDEFAQKRSLTAIAASDVCRLRG